MGFPGAAGRLPAECATIGQVLQDNGYATMWLGKNHNVPVEDLSPGGSKSEWPLSKGFDRFYGFLGGETNQWYPDLIEDNHAIEPPYTPEEGYHLSKDLADQAIRMLRDLRSSAPSKPWFMWFCPGANHAPHHAPQEYIDKYKGVFDDGYEAYREWVLARMIERGVVPEGTELTPLNPMPDDVANEADYVRPWAELNDDEKKLFCRMAEVFAGFSEYTDVQVGRIVDFLEQTGQLDNTIDLLLRRQRGLRRGHPERVGEREQVLQRLPRQPRGEPVLLRRARRPGDLQPLPDRLGGGVLHAVPDVQALLAVRRRHLRSAGRSTGPRESRPRARCATSTTTPPTSCRRSSRRSVWRCRRCTGASSSTRSTGCRCATASTTPMRRPPRSGSTSRCSVLAASGRTAGRPPPCTPRSAARDTSTSDVWELYHVDEDRAEARNLAGQYPEKLQELIDAWFEEAEANFVLPLDDRPAVEQINDERPQGEPPRSRYVYYPDTAPVPESTAVNIRGRSYKILADVEVTPESEGVIFAHGSRFGGHTLFIKDRKLHYVYNFLGIKPEQTFVSPELEPGQLTLGVEFVREGAGEHMESVGTAKLYVGEQVVAEGPMRAQIGPFTLCGDGLCVGYDSADPVSRSYPAGFPFTGGRILGAAVDIGEDQYLDLEREAAAAFARD